MNRQTILNIAFLVALLALGGWNFAQRQEIGELRRTVESAPAAKPRPPAVATGSGAKSNAHAAPGAAQNAEQPTGPVSREEVQQLTAQVQQLREIAAQAPGNYSRLGRVRTSLDSIESSGDAVDIFVEPTPMTLEQAEEYVKNRPKVAGKGPSWSDAQATGAPDTNGGGDIQTAWAPRSPQSGEQWLQVGYDKAVEIGSINVHETYNPGALSKVTAILPDGSEREIWSGTAPKGEPPVETSIPVPKGITSDKIRVYVDTNRVPSWPEIDAVELVGADGSRQWASSSTASSHYGDAQSMVPQANTSNDLGLQVEQLTRSLSLPAGATRETGGTPAAR